MDSFGYNCTTYATDALGPVYLAGSGSDDLKYFLHSLPSAKTQDVQNSSAIVRALCTSLGVSGGLLMGEVASAQSLLQYYGAGYELASFNNGRFRKLGDVTYIFWYVEVDDEGFNVSPPREIFKYQYFKDVLVIRSARLNDPKYLTNLSFTDELTAVPPIYRDLTDEEVRAFRIPDMNSHFLCNYFFIRRPNLPIYTFARVDYRQDSNSLVHFREVSGGIEMGFEKRFIEAATNSNRQAVTYT